MLFLPETPTKDADLFPFALFPANDMCLVLTSRDRGPVTYRLDEERKRQLDEIELQLASASVVHDDFEDHWREGTPTRLLMLPFRYEDGKKIDMFISDVPGFIDEEMIERYEAKLSEEQAGAEDDEEALPSVTSLRLDAIGELIREHPEALLPIYYKLSKMDLFEQAE